MKKLFLTATLLTTSIALLSGCQKNPETDTTSKEASVENVDEKASSVSENSELKGEIEILTNANETTFNAVNSIFEKFMEENPGVTITYATQESDYEQLMKARMASNDLPDIFATHGWSVARYSEYLRPLNDQPWFDTIQPSFLSIIENDEKEVFVLPINQDQGGLFYNKGLLEELNAEVPQSWNDLLAVCAQGKEKGYEGVFLAGKDSRQPANLLDIAATTFLLSREDRDFITPLTDGTFNWQEDWAPVSQLLMDLKNNGYLNVDCATCDPVDLNGRLAENKTLFVIGSSQDMIEQIKAINPEAEFAMAPIPALDGQKPAFCGGEREAYGIWKDTENEEVCLAILKYLAQPENIKIVCEASGKLPAIKDVDVDLGTVADDYSKYADVPMYGFLDRVYLPNGMWSTLKTIGSAMIAGEMTVEESAKIMEDDYNTLRIQ